MPPVTLLLYDVNMTTILTQGGLRRASGGNVTDEVWKEYIKNQRSPEPDDDFTVV